MNSMVPGDVARERGSGKAQQRAAMTRRSFLGASTATVAGAVLAAVEPPRGTSVPPRLADVVIVGAGLAGLTAARALLKAGVASVLVLEARDRVGGRTLNQDIGGGHVVEAGGQWVGPTQTHIRKLAETLGVKTFKTYNKGKSVSWVGGRRSTRAAAGLTPADLLDFSRAQAKLEALSRTVPLGKPWSAAKADVYDAQTVASWLKENTATAGARAMFEMALEASLGKAEDVSLLYFLLYLHSAGGLDALENTEGGAQESRFVGGSQILSLRLAEKLKDRVVLGAPVVRVVDRPPKPVQVVTATAGFEARRVVVAMMPADTRRIEFDPGLPAARRGLVDGWKGSPAFKVNVVYDQPFWRGEGLNGQATGELPLVGMTFDNSPPEGRPGVLVAFLNDEAAARLKSPPARREAVLKDLAKYFGDAALRPTGYVEMDWGAEKWTRGCVSPVGPRLLTRFGPALREPVGRIHWAGTETAEVWTGYMEGAVRSGERVADEVVAKLK